MARAVEAEIFNPSRMRLIPNGVEVGSPESPTPTAYKDPPRLLFVGKLERVKGPDLFLAALEILDSEGWRFDVGIAGAGSLEAELRIAAGRLKRQKVTFCGSVGHDAVRSLYQAADIVVVPSRYEAFGIVVLEAMAAGRPLVATSVGGIPEIVNAPRNAILVAPEAASIAAGIRRLASDPDLGRRMAVANREDVASFSWSRIAPRYLELFRELLPATTAVDYSTSIRLSVPKRGRMTSRGVNCCRAATTDRIASMKSSSDRLLTTRPHSRVSSVNGHAASLTTTGRLHDRASSRARPNPSYLEGRKKKSLAAYQSRRCSWAMRPSDQMFPWRLPSPPATTNRTSGIRDATRTNTSYPFVKCGRPTKSPMGTRCGRPRSARIEARFAGRNVPVSTATGIKCAWRR